MDILWPFAYAAWQLFFAIEAHQWGFLSFHAHFGSLSELLVELVLPETQQACLALELVVLARRVPSACAAWAHQVLVPALMFLPSVPCPSAGVKHVFASRAPVLIGCQLLLPDLFVCDTTLAYCAAEVLGCSPLPTGVLVLVSESCPDRLSKALPLGHRNMRRPLDAMPVVVLRVRFLFVRHFLPSGSFRVTPST